MQLDPSEEGTYSPGAGRSLFQIGELKFGVAICHEGWRYPETVRWPARHGTRRLPAVEFRQSGEGSPTTSAVVRPDGTLLSYQPYGKPGLLIADIDIAEATDLLAARCKYRTEFTMDESKFKTVDEHTAAQPERTTTRNAVSQAEERLAYNMASRKLNGRPLISFADWTNTTLSTAPMT